MTTTKNNKIQAKSLEWMNLILDKYPASKASIYMSSVLDLGESKKEVEATYRFFLDHEYHLIFVDNPFANTEPVFAALDNINDEQYMQLLLQPVSGKINGDQNHNLDDYIRNKFFGWCVCSVGNEFARQYHKNIEYRNKLSKAKADRKLQGKPNGRKRGAKNLSAAMLKCIPVILTESMFFGGQRTDKEIIGITVARGSYYKYKKIASDIWVSLSETERDKYKEDYYSDSGIVQIMSRSMTISEKKKAATKLGLRSPGSSD